jgi:outer membrane protein assembly factor BamB
MRAYLILALSAALCAAPLPVRAADAVAITPRVIPVGQWPEGLVFQGERLLVAESGQRTVAEIDPQSGAVVKRWTVGRLPVGMALGADGAVSALIQTDKLVWRLAADGRVNSFGQLAGCPDGLAVGGPYVWVSSEPDCSSETGQLIRIDPRNGARASTGNLKSSASALLALPGRILIARYNAPALGIVAEADLSASSAEVADARLWAMSGDAGRVFVGGNLISSAAQGFVASLDSGTLKERRRQPVDQRIVAIANDDRDVVAVGEHGRILVFAADTLDYLRTINLTTGSGDFASLVIHDDSLYITDRNGKGTKGSVLALSGWRPQPVAAPTPAAQPTNTPAVAKACTYRVANLDPSAVLWMRQQPDANSAKVVGVPADATGLTGGECTQDWCYVTFGAEKGWVWRQNLASTCQ